MLYSTQRKVVSSKKTKWIREVTIQIKTNLLSANIKYFMTRMLLKKIGYIKEYIENFCNDRDVSFQQSLRKGFLRNNPQSSLKSDVRPMQFHPVHKNACVKLSSWE